MSRLALVVLLLVALAGCGGGGGSSPRPRSHVVEIRGFVFTPAALTVAPGDTVVWRNLDILPHTATSAGDWDSGAIAGGAEWRWVAVAGDFTYRCSFHPTMLGRVAVARGR